MHTATAVRHHDPVPDDATRGQEIRRRRKALGLTQVELGEESGVTEPTIRNLEGDKYREPTTIGAVLAALDRLEAERGQVGTPRPHRRATDSPKRRALEAVIETQEGEQATIYLLGDDLRAVFVVPEGMRVPTMEAMRRAIQEALDEE